MPDLPGYIGIDIVPEAVQAAAERFPGRTYHVGDICTAELPRCDVIVARDVLAHLSNAEVLKALGNFRRSGPIWLCATTFEGSDNTRDTRAGGYHEYDLEAPPFALGRPWLVIEDGYWEDELIYPTKYLGVWACAW